MDNDERQVNKAIYAGKRFYLALVDIKNELHSARQQKVTDEELGLFAELDIEGLIAEARRIGQVPVWNAEATPVGKKLTYTLYDGAKPVAQ